MKHIREDEASEKSIHLHIHTPFTSRIQCINLLVHCQDEESLHQSHPKRHIKCNTVNRTENMVQKPFLRNFLPKIKCRYKVLIENEYLN